MALLRSTFNVDFGGYRDTTITRRIRRRMVLHTQDSLGDYARHLEQNRSEIDSLFQDLLIGVTSFFREPEAFEALKKNVFPQIALGKNANTPIRIWAPGCSTGQEAYSLAMALLEFLDEQPMQPAVQIFASDLSDIVSLHKAREGIYPENIEAEVSPERLRRFFTKENSKYRVNKAIRDLCIFAKHNLAVDPPFSRVDLISCRNVLIYLGAPLQKRVIPILHYALNPVGFLMLGSSETVGTFTTDLFTVADQKNRIYAKKVIAGRQYPYYSSDEVYRGALDARVVAVPSAAPAEWQREADRITLGQYAPPGVLVNENFDILQFRGETGAYLKPAAGEPSYNLFKMAREGLFIELRSALNECRQTGAKVRREKVRVRGEGLDREIDLQIVPVKLPHAGNHCFLILFDETVRRASTPQDTGIKEPSKKGRDSETAVLQQELISTREYLQSVIEQQDGLNEELKSTNEEILSSNEELQSTNEELETAKEELQSMNEELTTVNEQLQNRNLELSRMADALANLQTSADVAMVELGVDLRIRRFTPAVAKVLNLLSGDIGRPIGNLKLPVETGNLEELVAQVIATAQVKEREVRDTDGRWYALRVHPYRTADNRIDGAVAVFADIDEAKAAQVALRDARDYAENIIETMRDPLLVLDKELRVVSANQAFYRAFVVTPAETEGRLVYDLGNGQWNIPGLRQLLETILPETKVLENFVVKHSFERVGPKTMLLNARRVVHDSQDQQLILLAMEDVTERTEAEETLRQSDSRKNEFLAMLAHELRNPLGPVRTGLAILNRIGSKERVAQETRAIMERQVDHMARLLDDLLDISRITTGKIELHKGRVELAELLRQVAETYRSSWEEASQELTVTIAAEPMMLHADRARLTQIFGNLLTNAVKYSDPGGRIELTARRVGSEAVVQLRDQGIGIAPEILPRIWGLFVQAESSAERFRSGLGIGLSLVHTLVKLHGGTVDAQSAGLGQGSEFTVRLPLANEDGSTTDEKNIDTARTGAAVLSANPHLSKRILVVDDNMDSAASLSTMLRLIGNEVRMFHDGPEALKAAAVFRPEVAFLDVGMPKMDGYELARRLRCDLGADVLLVAVTGYATADDRRRAHEAGFDEHLVKPVAPAALQALLSEKK